MRNSFRLALFASLMIPATAFAQVDPSTPDSTDETSEGTDVDGDGADEELNSGNTGDNGDMGEPLPESKSDDDMAPPVASPGTPSGGIVSQAGIGGQVGYGRAGVLELGGSAGFTAGSDFTQINITPSIGWFVADNLQLSGRLSFSYVKTEESASLTTALIEPSYHLPFNRSVFGFAGLGMGVAHVSGGPGVGFALAPRIGAQFMVGRSGVLTPALLWQYTTHDTMDTGMGALLVVSSAVVANIGYTVMW